MHGDAGEDAELGAGVEAVDVGGGIGFGVTELLGVGEDGGVVGASLHAGEDVVAGAVDDAAEAGDLVAAEALKHAGDDGDSAGDGCSVDELDVVLGGEFGEAGAAIGDELLVGCDDGFAGGDGLAEPRFGWVEAAHQLDDDIYPGVPMTLTFSVQMVVDGTNFAAADARLRATLRLKMWVSWMPGNFCAARTVATELPTVPKPRRATVTGRSCGLLLDADFDCAAFLFAMS